jgi:hypothetical protein
LATTTGGAAWLEGWVMPVEKAIEDVLAARDVGSSSSVLVERAHHLDQ